MCWCLGDITHKRAKNRGQKSFGSNDRVETKKNKRRTDEHDRSHYLGWRRGVVVSVVRCMNDINPRRAWLVPGWVTVFGRAYHLGMQPANQVNSAYHHPGVAKSNTSFEWG